MVFHLAERNLNKHTRTTPSSFLFAGDGLIQEKELQHVMRACMDENGMKFDEGEVDDLTRALFHDATMVANASRNEEQLL